MFLPYQNYNPEFCNNHGYRYSMSNCVFESAMEACLSECGCYPLFHQNEYQVRKGKNMSVLYSQPYHSTSSYN